MWQVGDSSQQNEAYNMELGAYKTNLIDEKDIMMMQLTIEPYQIIMMVNYAWDCSSGRTVSNKKVIIDRYWYPLDLQLLLWPILWSTMTIEEKYHEEAAGIIIPRSSNMPTSAELLPISTLSQEFIHPSIAPSSQV